VGVVKFGNARNDRQAKPGALAIAQAYEALEQLATQLAGDAWAAVGNLQGQVVRRGMQLDVDTPAVRGVLQRIAHQVLQQGGEARGVADQIEIGLIIGFQRQFLLTC